jgi:hypothetical protein
MSVYSFLRNEGYLLPISLVFHFLTVFSIHGMN